MIRLLMHLLGKPYEECKSCETLRQQLAFVQEEKKELLETLLNIVKPKVFEAPVKHIEPLAATGMTFARRRAALESRDKEVARTMRDSKFVAAPDGVKVSSLKPLSVTQTTSELEEELGINEATTEEKGDN